MSRLVSTQQRVRQAARNVMTRLTGQPERGDVPGWVLVTLMTAGLVTLLWQTAGPLLKNMFTAAMNKVSGG